ncbi:NADH dehydrogenase subunit 4 [Iris pallida]|uniref:NADH dehydrogenase subunit 4 (Mitochondrion) n=1 Tax=Iris pallida TaxID=29817 RepID=A0AAX6GG60_IRIPA|nr:NADH dehydrogenase subunit 4 [Iris pallida]
MDPEGSRTRCVPFVRIANIPRTTGRRAFTGRPGRAQVPDPKSRVSISLVHQPRGTTGTQRPGE